MRYRVKTTWKSTQQGPWTLLDPAFHGIEGISWEDTTGLPAEDGGEVDGIITCDPALIPQIEATGTVILETLGE